VVRYKRYDLTEPLGKLSTRRNYFEEVKEAIGKCSTIEEFRKDYVLYQQWVMKHKRFDLIQHFDLGTRFGSRDTKLTEEVVIDTISKCTTLRELREQHSRVIGWCRKRKREDLYKDLQREVVSVKRTEESVKSDIQKCSSLNELMDNYNKVYQWCQYHKRKDLYQHLYTHPGKIRNRIGKV